MMEKALKHGARIYPLNSGNVLVKQTVQPNAGAKYVIDEQRERHVPLDDDTKLGAAIRDALQGVLPKGKAGRLVQ